MKFSMQYPDSLSY